tara:strand:- start:105 stop:350 length:246 start_codon:yes stop_codon:yes gene_type:complete
MAKRSAYALTMRSACSAEQNGGRTGSGRGTTNKDGQQQLRAKRQKIWDVVCKSTGGGSEINPFLYGERARKMLLNPNTPYT